MDKRDRARTCMLVFLCLLLVLPGCNSLAARSSGGSENGDREDAQDHDQGKDQPTFFSAALALIYDHHAAWDFSSGQNGMRMSIDVSGSVPFQITHTGAGMVAIPNQGESIDLPWFQVGGSGKVDISGQYAFFTEKDRCDCEFSDAIDVTIRGKTWWKPNALGNVDEKVNLELNETWYSEPDWQCTCSDPELEPFARMNMQQIPAWRPEGLTDQTLEFIFWCDGSFRQEQFAGAGGSGQYEWRYRGPDPGVTKQVKEAYDDELSPLGQLLCSDVQGEWGPPLSAIQQDVSQWYQAP